MTAVWLWIRSDLRARWRSWIVLGLLAGAVAGLAAAGVAGARRTANAVPDFAAAARVPNAGVFANDPSYDTALRQQVTELPEVRAAYPFAVAFALDVKPHGFNTALLPAEPASVRPMVGVLVAGRTPDPSRADEVVVDENARRRFGLGLGTTITVSQSISPAEAPPGFVPLGVNLNFSSRLRVVGIAKAVSGDTNWVPSFGFYAEYGPRLAGFVNQFISLRHGNADFARLQGDVQRIVGHPVNVVNLAHNVQKSRDVTQVEEDGLLLFALSVIIGGGVLVGQALVRAVTAGAGDLPTWQAMGADRRMAVRGLTLPTILTVVTGVVTMIVVAVAVSSRFPIGVARHFDLAVGTHADWPVLAIATLAMIVAILACAWLSAVWRVTHLQSVAAPTSTTSRWATRVGLPPSLLIGSRLAVEPGRGKRAVPVRSAMIGAIAGVLGVVACFTFRAGIGDAVASPERSGVVWNFELVSGAGPVAPKDLASITQERGVDSVLDAVWARAVRINGVPTPTFGTSSRKGAMQLVVLNGHAPRHRNEIAFAPSTMADLKLQVGDRIFVGVGRGHATRVVGTALLPATSHTDYDQSAWMTAAGLRSALGDPSKLAPDDLQDYVLIRWAKHAHVASKAKRISALGAATAAYETQPAALPTAVADLKQLRSLPLALGVFFGLLASATVAHALVTTVRRRNHDLAVLRSLGFTRGQSRIAIAWQATLLAIAGIVVGVPLGIATGRLIWRWLAENFPVVYVPPLALLAVLIVIPAALAVANLLAAAPGHAATRIRPAEALRTE